jgi:hypothetical protein
MNSSPYSVCQAAAVARIAGRPHICSAASTGDLALVQDHLAVNAAAINQRDDGDYVQHCFLSS